MIERNALVSICVQTYNHKNYIKQCLDGILMQQTDFPFEIILGEDESNDGTREICKSYAEQYPDKIRLFLRSRKDVIYVNGRPTGRYNFMENLKACRGKYIALCEGDDYWTDPLKLQKQVDFLENNSDINLIYNRANVLSNTLKSQTTGIEFLEKKFKFNLLLEEHNFITTASVVLRKPEKLFFPKWFQNIEFGDLALYYLINDNQYFYGLSDLMSVYRINDKGIYSGLIEIEAKKNYLSFYKKLYNIISPDQKKIIFKKINNLKREISFLRFPNNSLLRFLYFKTL